MGPFTLRKTLLVFLGITALVYLINFFILAFLIGPFDYDHLSGYYELSYKFWVSSPGIPHFNPFLCGGRTLGGDPQIPIFSLIPLFVGILGATVAIKWELLVQMILGTHGLFQLFELEGLSVDQKLFGAFLWLTGGATVSRFMVGHVTLGFFLLFPLMIALSRRLTTNKAIFFYCLLFVYAGHYKPNFFIYGLPLLSAEVFFRSLLTRDKKPLLVFFLAVFLSGLTNAMTILPSLKYFSDFPRLNGAEEQTAAWYAFFANLLLPLKAVPKALYGPGFFQRHEYSIFLGPVPLYFALRPKRFDKPLLFVAILGFLLGLGVFPFSLFERFWPGFSSVRVCTRFWFAPFLFFILLAAKGFKLPSTKLGASVLVVLGLIPLLASASVNLFKTSVLATETQWVTRREYPGKIELVHSTHQDIAYSYLREGKATIECVPNLENFKTPALRVGPLFEPLIPVKGRFQFKLLDWHELHVEGQLGSPTKVQLNLNHADYWRFEGDGAKIVSKLGEPLTLEVSPRFDGHLIFEQPWEKKGLLLSLIGAFLLFGTSLALLMRRT